MSSWACPSPPRAIRYCLPVALCQHSSSSTEILVGGAPSEHQYQIGLCERHWQTIHSLRVGSNTPTTTPGLYDWAVKLAYFRGPQTSNAPSALHVCTSSYHIHVAHSSDATRSARTRGFILALILALFLTLKKSPRSTLYDLYNSQGSNFQSPNL